VLLCARYSRSWADLISLPATLAEKVANHGAEENPEFEGAVETIEAKGSSVKPWQREVLRRAGRWRGFRGCGASRGLSRIPIADSARVIYSACE